MPDKLRNVKAFYVENVIDGFGIAKYVGFDKYGEDARFLHSRILPALYEAIQADDPDYDANRDYLAGEFTSEAKSTDAVRWFVELMEGHKAFQQLIDPRGEIYNRLYEPGQHGCFLDGLRAALTADDPEWRGGSHAGA